MAKRKPLERPDVMVEAREVEAVSLECSGCRARVEVPWDGKLREDATCPCCGSAMREQHRTWERFAALFGDIGGDSGVRFRVRLLSRPKERK
jgi:uncharacterized paraquat-inducible protein A